LPPAAGAGAAVVCSGVGVKARFRSAVRRACFFGGVARVDALSMAQRGLVSESLEGEGFFVVMYLVSKFLLVRELGADGRGEEDSAVDIDCPSR
jgi:hypothetical protein